MGQYSERVKEQHKHMSPEQIRAAKCQRSHNRNLERMGVRRLEAETRNAKSINENRREFRRVNKLGEFAV